MKKKDIDVYADELMSKGFREGEAVRLYMAGYIDEAWMLMCKLRKKQGLPIRSKIYNVPLRGKNFFIRKPIYK